MITLCLLFFFNNIKFALVHVSDIPHANDACIFAALDIPFAPGHISNYVLLTFSPTTA